MTQLPFVQIDAFADAPFTGNPAAVMRLDAWLDDATLLAIAQENSLSETAFAVPLPAGSGADHELRWFTPACEVALCGHATLASGHALLGADQTQIRFRTRKAGDLVVRRDGAGYALDLPAWSTQPDETPPDFAALLRGPVPLECLQRPGGYRLARYADETTIRALAPDFRALAALGNLLVIVTAPGANTAIVSRAFAPGAGIDEDPVTGSAHALLVPYWAEKLGRTAFSAYQASARGGHLGCRLAGERVILTGKCRTVIEGMFRL